MKKMLFLDLEGTIITSWNNPFIIHSDVIKKFIERNEFDSICIFSFAIYHEADKIHFLTDPNFKKEIESVLGIQLNLSFIPTIKDLTSLFAQEYNLPPSKVQQNDFFDFNNKESGFINYCRRMRDCECTLIDDAIWDEIDMKITNRNVTIKTINIETLKAKHDL